MRSLGVVMLVMLAACGPALDDSPDASSVSPALHPRPVSALLTNVPVQIKFDDFSNTQTLQLNGSAVQLGNDIRLTDSSMFETASAFFRILSA